MKNAESRNRISVFRWIGACGSDEIGSVVRAVLDATNENDRSSGCRARPDALPCQHDEPLRTDIWDVGLSLRALDV